MFELIYLITFRISSNAIAILIIFQTLLEFDSKIAISKSLLIKKRDKAIFNIVNNLIIKKINFEILFINKLKNFLFFKIIYN